MYYDGTKLLSLKDINGGQPEIFILDGNRTSGKTTYFSRLLVNRFLKNASKFMLIYRYSNEMSEVCDKFFKDISGLFFKGYTMHSENMSKGLYQNLIIEHNITGNTKHCGYAVALNSSDKLKRFSHLFSDTSSMFFDEFQLETGKYLSDEIQKFISLHTTVARGQGEMVRHVPVYMVSNATSLLNPYYTHLGISKRLRADTSFLRGDGWVFEYNINRDAQQSLQSSAFNRAFSGNRYIRMASESIYLNDNTAFVKNMKGRSFYFATLRYNEKDFGLRQMSDTGLFYISHSVDSHCLNRWVVNTNELIDNYSLIHQRLNTYGMLRNYFQKGMFRFQDLECKECALNMLAYH